MNDALIILGGAAAAAVLVVAASFLKTPTRHKVYGVALIVAALIYVGFAVGDMFFLQELGGAFIFAAMAVAGMRGYPWALALGWALHVTWDVGFHGAYSPIAPSWYPLACVGFDLVVAGAILSELAGRKD